MGTVPKIFFEIGGAPMASLRKYASIAARFAGFILTVAAVVGYSFLSAGTAGATPVVSSYTSVYSGEQWASERGFASLVVNRDVDGTLSVSGEKLDGESVAIAIHVSINGGPFELAQTQPGISSVRLNSGVEQVVEGYSKATLRNGDNVLFDLRYTPPADAQDVKYNVTIAGAEQAEGGWLISIHEPTPGAVEL